MLVLAMLALSAQTVYTLSIDTELSSSDASSGVTLQAVKRYVESQEGK